MPTTDPKKLAALLATARGKANYDALIASTFEALQRKTVRGTEPAWTLLELAGERACTTGTKRVGKSSYFEREVRVLGPVVAWRDSAVTSVRRPGKPGKMSLEIAPTRAAARARAIEVADQKDVVWGTRPAADEPADLNAHRALRAKLFASGDLAKLAAYKKRYAREALLFTMEREGAKRQLGYPVWDIDQIIQEAARHSDDPKVFKALLVEKPKYGIDSAAATAMRNKHAKTFALLLPLVKDMNAEVGSSDTFLAIAVREKLTDAIAVLLKKKADPNALMVPWGVNPKFTVAEEDGNGPMVNAVRNGDVETLKKLIAAGGDPNLSTRESRPLIEMARQLGNNKVIALLEGKKDKKAMTLEQAIDNNEVSRVLELISKKNIEWALPHAARTGKVDVLRAICDSKVKKDPAHLAQALWYASFAGAEVSVAFFLERKVDPNYVDPTFGTPLGAAQYKNFPTIAQMLKRAGAKVRIKTK